MPDRRRFVWMLWLMSSLALLASMLVAPNRTSRVVFVSSRPDCVSRNFAPPSGESTTRLSSPMATYALVQVNALPSEDEEQDRADALDEPRFSFLIPCSFCKVLDREVIAPRTILTLYPLRC